MYIPCRGHAVIEAAKSAEERANREAEKSAAVEAALKAAEEQRDAEALRAEQAEAELNAVSEQLALEVDRAERAEVARKDDVDASERPLSAACTCIRMPAAGAPQARIK